MGSNGSPLLKDMHLKPQNDELKPMGLHPQAFVDALRHTLADMPDFMGFGSNRSLSTSCHNLHPPPRIAEATPSNPGFPHNNAPWRFPMRYLNHLGLSLEKEASSPFEMSRNATFPASVNDPVSPSSSNAPNSHSPLEGSKRQSLWRLYAERRATLPNLTNVNESLPAQHSTSRPWVPTMLSSNEPRRSVRERWQQLGDKIKVKNRKKKEERKQHERSANLIAQLSAVTPAINILASSFQRDQHHRKKMPVLMDQISVKILASDAEGGNRSQVLVKVEVEYAGLIKWVVHREFRDFLKLHTRYRLAELQAGHIRGGKTLPKFPRAALPLRGKRPDDNDRIPSKDLSRTLGSGLAAGIGALAGAVGGAGILMKSEPFAIMQRKRLEEYLQSLIRLLMFRGESNRLCRFLELSAMGIRLASEGSYHGKEGHLIIVGGKGTNVRIGCSPSAFAERHKPKWFLVRHSYVICLNSAEGMDIYDVFMVDLDFKIESKSLLDTLSPRQSKLHHTHPQHHIFKLSNSERNLKLIAKNERQMSQFVHSIKSMSENNEWAVNHRFDSFAPVRHNVACHWLVDGRDYFWNVSRAIYRARDSIYIHDWWLSPELHLRRPAAHSYRWRLDRLLQKKAEEGVKIFVIVYHNVGQTVPIDSQYTKNTLINLHPNIFVQRSPSHLRQQTFFWAHHDKICIIDYDIAFCGGLDLCYGRWDTSEHVLADNRPLGFGDGHEDQIPSDPQIWPGKDYSNPRILDFHTLDKPFEELYDRSEVPRMPWHDVSMLVVGQPARDLTRHFIQRWNYFIRQKKPNRPTPFLLPPPDFHSAELENLGLTGTCEVQILRSASAWSLGTTSRTEHSIMNAYCACIRKSEHFVYIENQFFVTSTVCDGTKIENHIGDALFERIVRAHEEQDNWKAVILVPLMPGFQNTVDSQDGGSIRLIMHAQYRSICRSEHSLWGRLHKHDIKPKDYIRFYGLRGWGEIGDHGQVVTEMTMIVDDRVAIIGSANINERSMRGNRDSEAAIIIRDRDMMESTMGGDPYAVGRFPHTLRMRLQREHLGINVDHLEQQERMMDGLDKSPPWRNHDGWDPEKQNDIGGPDKIDTVKYEKPQAAPVLIRMGPLTSPSFNHDVDWVQEKNKDNRQGTISSSSEDEAEEPNIRLKLKGVGEKLRQAATIKDGKIGRTKVTTTTNQIPGVTSDYCGKQPQPEVCKEELEQAKRDPEKHFSHQLSNGSSKREYSSSSIPDSAHPPSNPPSAANTPPLSDSTPKQGIARIHPGNGNTSIPSQEELGKPLISTVTGRIIPHIDPQGFKDPLVDEFFHDVWHATAKNNTKIFRNVFRPMPDNLVQTWREYKAWVIYGEKLARSQGFKHRKMTEQEKQHGYSCPPAAQKFQKPKAVGHGKLDETLDECAEKGGYEFSEHSKEANYHEKEKVESNETLGPVEPSSCNDTHRKRRTTFKKLNFSVDQVPEEEVIHQALGEVRGHLVEWPTEWLLKEDETGNWLYSMDKIVPFEIYD
ncbi:Phospholipase D1 [Neolecta irregularis DAH-3]|uniref:Phospholipase n=1 Tax=Neolecta irregularis (strain DAH-3) TaxID=1198029 RepID=A0A1U7LGM0_NEOID|nr:Phospholipase D1 [Neolecta irregularis DAH-3]|eukprot:OLL21743.1 Phospholipase D1 [Neolecta irregularis DAH-3]